MGLSALAAGNLILYAVRIGYKIKAEISRLVLEKQQHTLMMDGKPQHSPWPNVGIAVCWVTSSEWASNAPITALEGASGWLCDAELLPEGEGARAGRVGPVR